MRIKLSNEQITEVINQVASSTGPVSIDISDSQNEPDPAERQAVALERIAAALEADGLVDKPLQTSALIRIAAALERIVGQMEQRP